MANWLKRLKLWVFRPQRRIIHKRFLGIASVGVSLALLLTLIGYNVQFGAPSEAEHSGLTIGSNSMQVTITIGPEGAYGIPEADYVCDGVADNVQFQAALDALEATGGRLEVLAGTFTWAAGTTVSRAIDNITIVGTGRSTVINGDGVTALFSAGAQSNWVFRNFVTDAGGLTVTPGTGYVYENLLLGVVYHSYYFGGSRIGSDAALDFRVSGDADDYITFSTAGNLPLISGTGSFLSLGSSAATGHALGATDVLIGGVLEVDGTAWVDALLNLNGDVRSANAITIRASGDIDDYVTFSTAADRPLIAGTGEFLSLGSSAATGHGLGVADVLVAVDFEVNGEVWADGGVTLGADLTINGQVFDAGAGNAQINTTGGLAGLILQATSGGNGARVRLIQNFNAPLLNSTIAQHYYQAYDHAGAPTLNEYAIVNLIHSNIGDGTEEATFQWYMMAAGVQNNLAMTLSGPGDLWIDKSIHVATTPVDYIQNRFGGNFASQGAAAVAYKQYINGQLTAAIGDTTRITGTVFENSIVSQNAAEVIAAISQVYVIEPSITLQGGATATIAATLFVADAPTEGIANAAIYSGDDILVQNNKRLEWFNTGAGVVGVLYMDGSDEVVLNNTSGVIKMQTGVAQNLQMWGTTSGTSRFLYMRATDADAGNTLRDSPTLVLRAQYWTGAANQSWDYNILHDMQTAAGTPKSQVIHSINGVTALTLENDNGTVSTTIAGTLNAFTMGGTQTINGKAFDTGASHMFINTTANEGGIILTGNHATTGPGIKLVQGDTTPALNSLVALINFRGYDHDGAPTVTDMGQLQVVHSNIGDGTEEGTFRVILQAAGVQGNVAMTLSGPGDIWVDRNSDFSTGQHLINNLAQNADPGTTTDGEIRLWKDTDAGGVEGRILFRAGATSYTVNADAGITLYDHLAYQVAHKNPEPLGPDETRDYVTGEKFVVGDNVMFIVDRDGSTRGPNGRYDYIHLVPVKATPAMVAAMVPVTSQPVVWPVLAASLVPAALVAAWVWKKNRSLQRELDEVRR